MSRHLHGVPKQKDLQTYHGQVQCVTSAFGLVLGASGETVWANVLFLVTQNHVASVKCQYKSLKSYREKEDPKEMLSLV